jgi:hypothetical protein
MMIWLRYQRVISLETQVAHIHTNPRAEGEMKGHTEAALRKFLTEKLRISNESTKLIGFERIHRIGDKRHNPAI